MRTLYESIMQPRFPRLKIDESILTIGNGDHVKSYVGEAQFYVDMAKCFVETFGKIDRKVPKEYAGIAIGTIDVSDKNLTIRSLKGNDFMKKIREMSLKLKRKYTDLKWGIEEIYKTWEEGNIITYRCMIVWTTDEPEREVDWNFFIKYNKDTKRIICIYPQGWKHAMLNRDLLKIIEDNI